MTRRECIANAMSIMGWDSNELPSNIPRLDEESTGRPDSDLQLSFDWIQYPLGSGQSWMQVYLSLEEFADNIINMEQHTTAKTPRSYHSMCLFRVTGFYTPSGDFNSVPAQHFVGICKGSVWQYKDPKISETLHTFEPLRPEVDAWAYIN